jgi:hypothetical protein
VWLLGFASDLPRSAAFLLRAVIVAAGLSLLFVMVSWIPADTLPAILPTLMPTRLANFNAMTFVALLLGIVGAYRARVWSPVLALLLTVALLLGERSILWQWLEGHANVHGVPVWAPWLDVWAIFDIASVALILLTLAAWNTRRASGTAPAPLLRGVAHGAKVASGARFTLVVLFVVLGVAAWQRSAPRMRIFEDHTNSPVFRVASEGTGLLITGGNLHLVQLRTRRPVLLDGGGLDGLPYAPDSGPEMERILRDVYAIDFFNPPEEARHQGVIPKTYNRAVWEQFTLEKWRQIRYVYQVRHVLTEADWALNLPVIAQDRHLRLYQIPD